MRAYPGSTSQILLANKSQPALYGPMRSGYIYNPRTIEDQGVFTYQSSIVEAGAIYLGQFMSVGLMWSGLEAIDPASLNAIAMGGFYAYPTFRENVTFGPPEILYVSLLDPANPANSTTEPILPGQKWNAPDCYCGSVYVRAATAGHRFTAVLIQDEPQYPPTPLPGTFPPSGPVTRLTVLLAWLYKQYEDDDDLQAFVLSYNKYAQVYIDWFNSLNLPIYPSLQGGLLDWVAEGVYGISRPTLYSNVPYADGPFMTVEFLNQPFMALDLINDIENIATTSDDVFKRIITWHFYKGDGKNLTTSWLRRRIIRFMFGSNGGDSERPFQTLSIEWTRTNQLTIIIVSNWSTCDYSGAFMSGPFMDAPFMAFHANDDMRDVPAMAPVFKEGIDTGALESPDQYSTTVEIGPKGVFGNASLSYSVAAL